jgi:hypothetical protein
MEAAADELAALVDGDDGDGGSGSGGSGASRQTSALLPFLVAGAAHGHGARG